MQLCAPRHSMIMCSIRRLMQMLRQQHRNDRFAFNKYSRSCRYFIDMKCNIIILILITLCEPMSKCYGSAAVVIAISLLDIGFLLIFSKILLIQWRNWYYCVMSRMLVDTAHELYEQYGFKRDCAICLESFRNDQCSYLIHCGHRFHTHCLQKYEKTKPICCECPYCKERYLTTTQRCVFIPSFYSSVWTQNRIVSSYYFIDLYGIFRYLNVNVYLEYYLSDTCYWIIVFVQWFHFLFYNHGTMDSPSRLEVLLC
eukprot:223820_1